MTGEEATLLVIDALDALQIPYMLVGSFASNFYGLPRGTADADLVVHFGLQLPTGLMDRLGPMFHLDPQLSFEGITGTTRTVLEVPEVPFTIELFRLSDDPHDQER